MNWTWREIEQRQHSHFSFEKSVRREDTQRGNLNNQGAGSPPHSNTSVQPCECITSPHRTSRPTPKAEAQPTFRSATHSKDSPPRASATLFLVTCFLWAFGSVFQSFFLFFSGMISFAFGIAALSCSQGANR